MSACRGCGATIVWAKTRRGNAMPLDPDVVTIVTDDGEIVKGRVSHFATCPEAQRFRRRVMNKERQR